MEYDQRTTAVLVVGLFAVLAIGTIMSPMQTSTVGMVLGGLAVFGAALLFVGVRHGEYRAQH